MTITITYAGAESNVLMHSDGETLSIEVDGSEVYSGVSSEYATAQAFADSIGALEGFTAVLSDGEDSSIASIYVGAWDLVSSPAVVGVSPLSVLSSSALMSWEDAERLIGAKESDRLFIESLINSVSIAAERYYAHRPLRSQSYTRTIDHDGSDLIILDTYPITSVEVRVDRTRVFAEASIVEVLSYAEQGMIRAKTQGSFLSGYQVIRLAYTAGYDPVPADLVLACAESVAYSRTRLNQGGAGVRSMAAPNGINTTYELTFPMNAQRVFESYADRRV